MKVRKNWENYHNKNNDRSLNCSDEYSKGLKNFKNF